MLGNIKRRRYRENRVSRQRFKDIFLRRRRGLKKCSANLFRRGKGREFIEELGPRAPSKRRSRTLQLASVLPIHLQTKLNFTRRIRRGVDQAGGGNGRSGIGKKGLVVYRRQEIRPVEDIEEFSTELNVEVLRNPRHRNVLEERKVEIGKSWPNNRVPARIPKEVHAGARYRLIGRVQCEIARP